ncbi:CHAT domain-containing protein [Streptomyces sp. NPDC096323]|uniref:CHAT domain-containing protein n=1 Tax=Streptomyces sp. NPDC096323 TaxID=3155822 RepID=UPI00332282E0
MRADAGGRCRLPRAHGAQRSRQRADPDDDPAGAAERAGRGGERLRSTPCPTTSPSSTAPSTTSAPPSDLDEALADPHATHDGPGQPRVWWVPTGSLALLPVHAAGHRDGSRTLLDRVISSYTPTVRSLNTARAAPPAPAGPRTPLAVTLSRTPGLAIACVERAHRSADFPPNPRTARITDRLASRNLAVRAVSCAAPWTCLHRYF